MRLSTICILLAVIVVVGLAAGCGNENKPAEVPSKVATVNGEAISSSEYLTCVSESRGKDVLASLLQERVLVQWAKEEGVEVTDAQINAQKDILKKSYQYDQVVKQIGEELLTDQLKAIQAQVNLAEKFYGKSITDKDLQQAYDTMNKAQQFVHPAYKQILLIVNPDNQKMQDAMNDLKSGKSTDEIAEKYGAPVFNQDKQAVIFADENLKSKALSLYNAAQKTAIGQAGGVITIGKGPQTTFAVFKVLAERPAENRSLKDAREEVMRALLMQKTQMDPDFATKLNDKKKAAKIDVSIPRYADLKYRFLFPPEPQPQMPMMMPSAPPAPRK